MDFDTLLTIERNLKNIAVYTDNKDELLNAIAQKLNLPLVTSQQDDFEFYLLKIDNVLNLQGFVHGVKVHISVDFASGEANYRREHGGGKNQPIARAIGLKKLKTAKILDATAGLGGDSFVLACLGCEVIMLERSPVIAELLADGLRRGVLNENITSVISRMQLKNIESTVYFSALLDPPDVIYLDPMYPRRKKSARVKKEMQILQQLLAHEEDESLLDGALQLARERVVVKRPKGAEYLNNSAPSHSIESKKTRYDVYLCSI